MSVRGSRQAEAGFTLVEVMVVVAISGVVMASIFAVLVSGSRTDRRMNSFANNQEVMRQALVAVQRDIRSSEPLRPLSTSAQYALRIDLHVYDGIDAPAPTPIRWLVDPSARELRRERLDSSGNVAAVTYRLSGVANTAAAPLFSFLKANGSPYDLTSDAAADIAECTVRIHMVLIAAPDKGPAAARLESDAQLRNRRPGGAGCAGAGTP